MQKNDDWIKNRFKELAETSFSQNRYTYSGFLTMAEQDLLLQCTGSISHVSYTLFGGHDVCERQIVRFGSPKHLGYEQLFPIHCLCLSPVSLKYSGELGHRDFLGAVLNLGIERGTVGDIFTKNSCAYLYCLDTISQFIIDNLTVVKHTPVSVQAADCLSSEFFPQPEPVTLSVSSERLDAVIAALYRFSRSASLDYFKAGKVYINSRITLNSSIRPKDGDIISVRGKGRFIYDGILKETKKGRYRVSVRHFVS